MFGFVFFEVVKLKIFFLGVDKEYLDEFFCIYILIYSDIMFKIILVIFSEINKV